MSESAIAREVGKILIPAQMKDDFKAENKTYRTCAYCRVSTDSDEQMSSFELQNEHFKNLAGRHPNWDLRHIYADEGISGTSMKKREQFNLMIEACVNGEYDLIVTKSVSRFARNLLDCISTCRMLKDLPSPVGVYFETDSLFTLGEDSELKLSLLATFAQEESTKKRESMIWSLTVRFKNQRLLMPEPYGFTRARNAVGKYELDARLEIVEEEAEVVRFIYDAFLAGITIQSICDILNDLGIPTKTGNAKWNQGSVRYILSNERYCGNVLTWKTFTKSLFERKKIKNTKMDQYMYTNVHDPIVSVKKFEAAQLMLDNLKHGVRGLNAVHVVSEGIFTGYVPVNHHWINDDPNAYFEASNSTEPNARTFPIKKSDLCKFNLSGFQVVRGTMMTYRAERPSLTVTGDHLNFNTECVRSFSNVGYVQLLIHPSDRRIALRPCSKHAVHSIRWRINTDAPPGLKTINAPYFCSVLFKIMEWNPDYQYIIRGTYLEQGLERIIVFDVSSAISAAYVECEEDGKRRRVLLCPDDWNGSFGEEFYDFIIQNDLYYIRRNTLWGSQSEANAIPSGEEFNIPTIGSVETAIEKIRFHRSDNTGITSIRQENNG